MARRSSTGSTPADQEVRIGLVGKYVNLPDAYLSVVEALKHGGYACGAKVEIDWIAADDAEGLLAEGRLARPRRHRDPRRVRRPRHRGQDRRRRLRPRARRAVPRPVPRPAVRGHRVRPRRVRPRRRELERVRPAHAAPRHRPHGRAARRRRHGRHDAPRRLPGQARAGTHRAARPTARRSCTSGTVTATSSTTGTAPRSRSAAWCCSGTSPDDRLVEFIELPPTHPFFVGTQAHPEFKSRPDRPHPLFAAFVRAARDRAEGRRPAAAADRGRSRPAPAADLVSRRSGSSAPRRSATPASSASPTSRSQARRRAVRPARRAPSRRGRGRAGRRPTASVLLVRQYRAAAERDAARGRGGQARRRRRATRGDRAPRARGGDRPPRPAGWCKLCEFFNSPGFCDEYTYLFVATRHRGAATPRRRERRGGGDDRSSGSALDEVDDLIADGEIVDAKSIIGLLLARRYLGGEFRARDAPSNELRDDAGDGRCSTCSRARHLAARRARARANSLAAYRRDLRRYADFLRARGEHDPRAVSEATVPAYVEDSKRRRQRRRPPAVRAVLDRPGAGRGALLPPVLPRGGAPRRPTRARRSARPRVPQGIPKALTEAEVEALLDAVPGDDPRALRDRAILKAMVLWFLTRRLARQSRICQPACALLQR